MATTTAGTSSGRMRSMNPLYWIAPVIVVLLAVAYFAMRNPGPSQNPSTVNTEARSGEIGASGAVSETQEVPARTNDTDQR